MERKSLLTRKLPDEQREHATWGLGYLDVAAKEGRSLPAPNQYVHAVHLVEALAFEEDPTHPLSGVDVKKIGDFYELRDKGGVLGRINLRIYFCICKEERLIVVLGVYKKEDEGQLAKHMIIRMKHRLRDVRKLIPEIAKEKQG